MNQHGTINWTELNTSNVEQAKKFYGEAMGWTFDEMPMPGGVYTTIKIGEETVGGLLDISGPEFGGMPDTWFTYITVDNVDERLAKAKSVGANVMKEPWDMPGIGRIAIVQQPGGAVVGWITPAAN